MRRITCAAAVAAALSLAACGGGSGSSEPPKVELPQVEPAEPTQAEKEAAEQAAREKAQREAEQAAREQQERERLAREEAEREERERLAREEAERAATRLPFPYVPSGHYSINGLPRLTAEDAQHMPVYRDGERLYVGVDQGPKYVDTFTIGETGSPNLSIAYINRDLDAALPVVGQRGESEIRHGRIADGMGQQVVAAYLSQVTNNVVDRWSAPPTVRMTGPASAKDTERLIRAVQLVNAALPETAKLEIGTPLPRDAERFDTIHVSFVPASQFGGGPSAAAVSYSFPGTTALIQFNTESNSYFRDREAMILLAHELMHALGILAHVSPDFATIMEGTGAIHHVEQNGVQQPLSLLYPADREALRVLHRLRDGADPTSFGPWAASTLRIDGNGRYANFGVALRNGYAEPWAYGPAPETNLASNHTLSGSATWTGTLLGFSGRRPVAGDAAVSVTLATMTGRTDFTSLETWAANAAPGESGTGTQWLDGDLGYSIAVRGNTFRETGGDAGRLTGIFTGTAHEGAAGTLERSDLTAAFGASR